CEHVKIRSSYNLSAMSFNPAQIAAEIKKQIPNFKISYKENDFRQTIADSWPDRIDDSCAREDWNWANKFNLENMTLEMLHKLEILVQI
ncbi:MAG: NAD-dependent epimerase, partial [Flavobacterium sp.]